MTSLGFSNNLSFVVEEVINVMKQDLKRIGKGKSQDDTKHNHAYEKTSKLFLNILYSTRSTSESDLIERVHPPPPVLDLYKECLQLLAGFLSKLIQAKHETTPKEIILHKFCLNCKFCVYVLFELMLYPNMKVTRNHANELPDLSSANLQLLGKIAQEFGLYDEMLGIMITVSFLAKETLWDRLSMCNPSRFSNKRNMQDMKNAFIQRMLFWNAVTCDNDENHNFEPFPKLSEVAYQALFKHLLHTAQYLIYMSLKHERKIEEGSTRTLNSNVMKNVLFWMKRLWKMDYAKLQPLLIDLIQRKILCCTWEKTNSSVNEFCSTMSIFITELITNLVNEDCNLNGFSPIAKFLIGSIENLVTKNLIGGKEKRKALELLQMIFLGDVEQASIRNVNCMLEFIIGNVLHQDKHYESRVKAVEILEQVLDSNGRSTSSLRYSVDSIFSKLDLSLKLDPNQTVRFKILEVWNKLAEEKLKNDDSFVAKYFETILLKSCDKDKRIRVKCFELLQNYGICHVNKTLMTRESPTVGSVRTRCTNNLFRTSIQPYDSHSSLVSNMIKNVVILGILDEEKKVRDLSQQLFMDLVSGVGTPQKVLSELDLYYQGKACVNNETNQTTQSDTCHVWTFFETTLKSNIGFIYERTKSAPNCNDTLENSHNLALPNSE
ncbi:hypothetical protein C9374_011329 [Naegleria lovaniensis]|uniref:Uncharacterized protein n=1 Tax=Naegleria lovaniensis TaxID=51637 RepID=A0AA88KRE0_NAELO|nr:uncharacterized protein C9374_011329 [Naegleria lovaniensis]KAG2392604.1 hypothetical protein C9374_011329 [Naegleria lovaniensis]